MAHVVSEPFRSFASSSALDGSTLALGLAPALTPEGTRPSPSFFHGFATHPRAFAQGLVALADITATRYLHFLPSSLRDPVLTAHGDRLRAEVFSADNSVYARLDVLGDGLDGGAIAHGTTNVDIGQQTRRALALVPSSGLLHLDIGSDGFAASTPESTVIERPVEMPDRWVRALGNAAEVHAALVPRFALQNAAAVRVFIASLPPATAAGKSGWLVPGRGGVRIAARGGQDAVWIDGLNRLSALKRLVALQTGMTVYGPADGGAGGAAVEVSLPGARLVIALTEAAGRGYSGEGALLASLSAPGVLDDAALVSALLSFEPVIDVPRLAKDAALGESAVRDALAVLASSGRVGWDIRDAAYFHRELPDEPNRVQKDNPRLVRARGLAGRTGAIQPIPNAEAAWLVDGGNGVHRVSGVHATARVCTCTWYLRYGSSRGPCAHILAVGIASHEIPPSRDDI